MHEPQDAWGLGHLLWAMLSPDAAAAPFPGGGDPAGYTDAAYTPPRDAGAGGAAAAAAAGRIVRGLLRVDAGARSGLDDAVAALEALLFVSLALGGGGGAPPPGAAGGGGDGGAAEGVLQATMLAAAGAAAGAGQQLSVRAALAADFVASERAAPAALAATLARLYA
jgi:hypothetical protein